MLQNEIVTFVTKHLEMETSVRSMMKDDWNDVASIFREGIESGNATFETEVPDYVKWDSAHIEVCRLVAETDGEISGWAALIPVSSRKVYSGVAELNVYVAGKYRSKGIGTKLLKELIEESERYGFWTLQAGIFPENEVSLKMHQKAGFRVVGYREGPAKLNDTWRNTILLERRSRITGI